jgi:hypothetical protein
MCRKLQLLRAHGLVAKIAHSRRYRLTVCGLKVMTAVILLHQQQLPASLEASSHASGENTLVEKKHA